MTLYKVTLIYANGTTWYVGDFTSQQDADKWINEEKTRPYWDETTQVQIVVQEQ